MQVQADNERRKSRRFKIGEGIFAHVTSGIQALGKVLNLSEGGLAMEYVGEESSTMGRGTLLYLFGNGGKSYLANVPVRTISDFEIPREFAFSSLTSRRMGMAFEELTQTQISRLYDLIGKSNTN